MRFDCPSTLVGLAALSVQMLTNVPTATDRAASRTWCVPRTLVFHASSGYCSSSGRCLSAAAWNTASGQQFRKTAWTTSGSRMSASTTSEESSSAEPWIDSRTVCNTDSSRSSMNSSARQSRWIWRHSSEPIDPPASVTMTRLFARTPGDRVDARVDLPSAEQVADVEFGQFRDTRVGLEHLAQRRQDPHADAQFVRFSVELTQQDGAWVAHRDHEQGRAGPRDRVRQVRAAAAHGNTTDPQRVPRVVVVEQRDRQVAAFRIAQRGAHELPSTAPGPEDDHLLCGRVVRAPGAFVCPAQRAPHRPRGHECDEGRGERDGPRRERDRQAQIDHEGDEPDGDHHPRRLHRLVQAAHPSTARGTGARPDRPPTAGRARGAGTGRGSSGRRASPPTRI